MQNWGWMDETPEEEPSTLRTSAAPSGPWGVTLKPSSFVWRVKQATIPEALSGAPSFAYSIVIYTLQRGRNGFAPHIRDEEERVLEGSKDW